MFEQVENQPFINGWSKEADHSPVRVVVYGASLFLTAVTAALQQHPAIEMIHLPVVANESSILEQKPNVLLWQRHYPLENSERLLAAGVWLLEIDEQQNTITIQHQSCKEKHTKPIQNSTDLIAWIIEPARLESSGPVNKPSLK